jgi:Ca-activated chloride channel family protein
MRILIIMAILVPRQSFCQDATKHVRTGNEYYRQEQFARAASEYSKALEKDPNNLLAKFNEANAIYKQDQKVDAAKIYSSITNATDKKDFLNLAFYNKGVILSQQKNIEESIEAYKNALRNDPTDKDARENLQKALLELKRKPPPPKKEEKKDNKKQQQQQQKQQQQSKMSPKETDQKLQLLQQKEKEVQQRLQKEKSKGGGSRPKDW